ncbi:MAG: GNAT family N-acetyltransferase [Bryobacteraceae bacterium]
MPRTADLAAVEAILRTDRVWSVYALADLAPEYRASAEWHVAADGRPALILIYRGFRTPLLFAHGAAADLAPLLPELAADPVFYFSVRAEAADLLRRGGFQIRDGKQMWRMVADPARFVPRPHHAVRLRPADCEALANLYRDGDAAGESPPFFHVDMLGQGVYFGIWEGTELVAAAGTHVLSQEQSLAAIGNVYTRTDRRGQGLGSQVSSAVTGELLQLGLRTVALNVVQTNTAALSVYERLGFTRHCDYLEGSGAGTLPAAGSPPACRH